MNMIDINQNFMKTHTYISKRTNNNKVKKGLILYSKEKRLINKIESKFLVKKNYF